MTKNDARWLENYKSFKEYVSSNAKLPNDVSIKSSVGTSISGWFPNQRDLFNQGKLSIEKVTLLNQINDGILIKPQKEINRDLFIQYKKVVFDKYDPDTIYLYKKGLISKDLFDSCTSSNIYLLSQVLEKFRDKRKQQINLLYSCMKDICSLPRLGICYLCATVVANTDFVYLYLEDKHRFVDYYSVVFKNFESDIKFIIKGLNLSKENIDIIDLYYGISSNNPLEMSMVEIGNMCGMTGEKARSIFHSTLRKISNLSKYNAEGKCVFGKQELSHVSSGEIEGDPYTMPLSDFGRLGYLSVRTFNCLHRSGIHNYKELREYLISVYDGASDSYISGLKTIRKLGSKCANEIYETAKKVGIAKKVFSIQ